MPRRSLGEGGRAGRGPSAARKTKVGRAEAASRADCLCGRRKLAALAGLRGAIRCADWFDLTAGAVCFRDPAQRRWGSDSAL